MFPVRNLKTGCFHLKEWVGKSLQITSFLTTLGLVANFGAVSSAQADDNEFHKTDQGISVNIGLIPLAKIKQNPAALSETKPHGSLPIGPHKYHLVVAVFDAVTGSRITDAAVKARISELGLVGNEIVMNPMKLNDVVTYGGFVSFQSAADYLIRIDVTRPGNNPVSFSFPYNHESP